MTQVRNQVAKVLVAMVLMSMCKTSSKQMEGVSTMVHRSKDIVVCKLFLFQ